MSHPILAIGFLVVLRARDYLRDISLKVPPVSSYEQNSHDFDIGLSKNLAFLSGIALDLTSLHKISTITSHTIKCHPAMKLG